MRIAITTLGCKINQYDSAVIRARLEDDRHAFVPFGAEADCYILNTCTVTDRADWEARQLIRRAKRSSPHARVIVTGCYAQVNPQALAEAPGVDFVVGLNRLEALVELVSDNDGVPPGDRVRVGDVRKVRGVPVQGVSRLPGHTRAFLKVQEGCNYSCTFCIIPTARGLSRSVAPDEVLAQLRALAAAGFVEVVITGIHLGSYGHDLTPRTDLTALLGRMLESGLVPRLRLSSLDPREVPERLIRLLARSAGVCSHLHVCAQAGDDRILKLMRRNYDTAFYRNMILGLRDALPEGALGTDIIVGFPGETEAEFERALEFFDSLPLTYFHVFPYSVRSGTVAAALPDHLSPEIKKERSRRMRQLGAAKRREFYRRFIGSRVSVLVEEAIDRESGAHKGHSRNYLPVLVRAGQDQVNREVDVSIEKLAGEWLRGSSVSG
jgi:threonylcarbamoyladenosine tRNA methylthiotransferase MtaB